mgnify:CR=1 FL=1
MTWGLHDKMAEKKIFYNSIAERDSILADQNTRGFHQLHDDFVDSDGNTTDGTIGRLTVTNKETREPPRQSKTLDEGLLQLLEKAGTDSSNDLVKLKKILDRES